MKYEIYIFEEVKTASFYKKAIAEYEKRLSRYCKIACRFVKKEREWEKLLAEAADAGNACLVQPGPDSVTSESFSQTIGQWEMSGQGKKQFFIPAAHFAGMEGGSTPKYYKDDKDDIDDTEDSGDKDKTENTEILNLSDFTMNTAMTAMILYEQIYRGYRILNHHPYHK